MLGCGGSKFGDCTLPVILLDVDGVINVLEPIDAAGYEYADVSVHRNFSVEVFPIYWRQVVVDYLNRVSRDGLAEIQWLTTWGQHAITALSPALGLDQFQVADTIERYRPQERIVWTPNWWKLNAIRRFAGVRRFAFIDDDLSEWTRAQIAAIAPDSFLLRPASRVGLTDDDLASLDAWLTGQN